MTRDKVIQGLRELAELLEQRPEVPLPSNLDSNQPCLYKWIWSKEQLHDIARKLGSFKKRYTDTKFELVVTLPSGLELIYQLDRESVCKKVVTWDCEDAESILKEIPGGEMVETSIAE